MNFESHKSTIEEAYGDLGRLSDPQVLRAVQESIIALDSGQLRVCMRLENGEWQVNTWLKKAILLSFAINRIEASEAGPFQYQDKIALKGRGSMKGVIMSVSKLPRMIATAATRVTPMMMGISTC